MLESRYISAKLSGEPLGATAARGVPAGMCAVSSAVEPNRGLSSLGT
jgi:hypothetical protein